MKILIVSSFLLLPVVLFPYIIPMNDIVCISQYGECNFKLKQEIEDFEGQALKKTYNDLNSFLSDDRLVSDFEINYRPPKKVEVRLVELKSDIAIREKNSDTFVLTAYDGQKISESSQSALPKVFIESDSIKYDSQESLFAASLLTELNRFYGINEVRINESEINSRYKDEIDIVFPVSADIDVLLGSLDLLLFQLKAKLPDTTISSIDLRYKNPVIK